MEHIEAGNRREHFIELMPSQLKANMAKHLKNLVRAKSQIAPMSQSTENPLTAYN